MRNSDRSYQNQDFTPSPKNFERTFAMLNILPSQLGLPYETIDTSTDQRSTSVLSDAQLARVARSGDAASRGVLLERHRAPLYALPSGSWATGAMHKTPSRTPSSRLCAYRPATLAGGGGGMAARHPAQHVLEASEFFDLRHR